MSTCDINVLRVADMMFFTRRLKTSAQVVSSDMIALCCLLSILCPAIAGSWRHVRIGQPFVDLQDMTAIVHCDLLRGRVVRPAIGYETPSHFGLVRQAMSDAVAENGLDLDTDTLTNGDCGLDAILRNLERLQLSNARAAQVLRVFRSGGRIAAVNAMRIILLIWIRDNRDSQLLPGSHHKKIYVRRCVCSPFR
jgi:hypothetical protein